MLSLPSLDEVDAQLAASSLREFVPMAWPIVEARPFKSNWHIDAICHHLEAVSAGDVRRLIVNIPPRHMKPVQVDARVLMASGERTRLGDIFLGDSVIDGDGYPATVTAVHEQGSLPVLRIETESGRTVRAAGDHPFLTPTGWVQAQDLEVGHTLATLANPKLWLDPLTIDEAYRLAGYFVGDGNTTACGTSCQANVTCHDPVQGEDVIACAEALGFEATWAKTAKRLNIKGGVRDWLFEHGLALKTSWTKRVPAFVMEGGTRGARQFLAAYFACDGTLNQRGDARKDLSVTFNSVNRELLADAQHLLLRLGVRSRLRVHRGNGYKGPDYRSWRLTITSQDDTARFVAEVPVIGAKAARLKAWDNKRTRFDSTYLPDRIVSITDDGEAECRCLTIDGAPSFTAEDLVVHNSLAVAVFWPCWDWIRRPETQWLFASYAEKLSMRDSLKCRRIVEAKGGRKVNGTIIERLGYAGLLRLLGQDWTLAPDQNAKLRFENTATGYRLATSVGGTATGEGGDILVIDDPHKADEVDTETGTQRINVLDWMDGTLSTRLNDPNTGRVVVVMQRLHEEDVTGHLVEQGGYEHLCLPAEFETAHPFAWRGDHVSARVAERLAASEDPDLCRLADGDPRGEEGELLWPGHFGHDALAELKLRMGAYRAAGQLQQRPAPAEGGIFKTAWWLYYDRTMLDWHPDSGEAALWPHWDRMWQSWDTALGEKRQNDWTVGQLWGSFGPDHYLLRQVRGKWSSTPEMTTQALELHRWAGERFPKHAMHPVFVEAASTGPKLMAALRKRIPGVIAVDAVNDKVQRANAITLMIETGHVYLPGERRMTGLGWQPAPSPATPEWVLGLIDECAGFPNVSHDDRVDALTQALNPARWQTSTRTKTDEHAERVRTVTGGWSERDV